MIKNWFQAAIFALQVFSALQFLYNGDPRQAAIIASVSVANLILAFW